MIRNWFISLFKVWRREFRLVFSDAGVLLFFFALPLAYPIVYTLIYNPEVPRRLPVTVVDRSRTADSREFVRMMGATSAISVAAYATDLDEARRMMNEKECFGIVEIPADYARSLGRGEQAVVTFYADMSLMLRYRTYLLALTDLQIALGEKIRADIVDTVGLPATDMASTPVADADNFLGVPAQGFASFVMPGIVILIIQQSLILGVLMLAGGRAERLRAGADPLAVAAPASASVLGRALCHTIIYVPLTIYILHFIPLMFSLPHVGSAADYLLFVLPLLPASSFLGASLSGLISERESSMPVFVVSSVIFLFLSGLTWPHYAFSPLLKWISDCVPSTWAVEGFIRINSNGATLADNSRAYAALWILAAAYFVIAVAAERYRRRRAG